MYSAIALAIIVLYVDFPRFHAWHELVSYGKQFMTTGKDVSNGEVAKEQKQPLAKHGRS